MSKTKHKTTILVESALEKIFDALGHKPVYNLTNKIRTDGPEEYREIRIHSQILLEAYRDPVVEKCIGDVIKRLVPGVSGAYSKQCNGRKVLAHNNVHSGGILIRIPT